MQVNKKTHNIINQTQILYNSMTFYAARIGFWRSFTLNFTLFSLEYILCAYSPPNPPKKFMTKFELEKHLVLYHLL